MDSRLPKPASSGWENPQKTVAGRQLAVYSKGALQTNSQKTVAGRQLAIYSKGPLQTKPQKTEAGRQLAVYRRLGGESNREIGFGSARSCDACGRGEAACARETMLLPRLGFGRLKNAAMSRVVARARPLPAC